MKLFIQRKQSNQNTEDLDEVFKLELDILYNGVIANIESIQEQRQWILGNTLTVAELYFYHEISQAIHILGG